MLYSAQAETTSKQWCLCCPCAYKAVQDSEKELIYIPFLYYTDIVIAMFRNSKLNRRTVSSDSRDHNPLDSLEYLCHLYERPVPLTG